MVIHRADMFGLAQLYQLRGRIGRSQGARLRLSHPAAEQGAARRRPSSACEVMQTLDTLGAGFQLASHDLDIRGAGNLLGDEQSGHIREVGIELYQQHAGGGGRRARSGRGARRPTAPTGRRRSTSACPVLIPESYVADLDVRLGLYRRIAGARRPREIDAFAAELIDRFGPLPRRGREPAADRGHQARSAARPASRRSRPAREGAVLSPSATTSSPSRRSSSPSSPSARPSSACAPTTSSSTARPGTTPRPASPASTS